MDVATALKSRVSVRAFLDKPVPQDVLTRIFQAAQSSPSNCNTQPWESYVVSGAKRDTLMQKLVAAVMAGNPPNPDFDWKVKYQGAHRDRQFASAMALYGAMGIERENKQGRQVAMLRNWQFFDAPHAVFFVMDKYLDIMGAVDIGIYAQSLALLMEENGISSCYQGALGQFPAPVREALGLSDEQGILFGMSFGYADPNAPANATRTARETLENAVHFISD
ncbi:MAG: nitroreductase family protein [Sphingomonadales bacterium]|nr:nitroreductase family protein [Sphingomonadales bacterium]